MRSTAPTLHAPPRAAVTTPPTLTSTATPATTPTAQVIVLDELHAPAPRQPSDAAGVLGSLNPLHGIRARLQVCVGEVELTVGELLAASEHQVFVLDRGLEQPVDLQLDGKTVARGQLVAMDGHFALRITELPLPLKP